MHANPKLQLDKQTNHSILSFAQNEQNRVTRTMKKSVASVFMDDIEFFYSYSVARSVCLSIARRLSHSFTLCLNCSTDLDVILTDTLRSPMKHCVIDGNF